MAIQFPLLAHDEDQLFSTLVDDILPGVVVFAVDAGGSTFQVYDGVLRLYGFGLVRCQKGLAVHVREDYHV